MSKEHCYVRDCSYLGRVQGTFLAGVQEVWSAT